ncbi:MAG: hypothetical protein PVH17_02185 [Anaerolineae bacterium]|jgi:hypothetical protein
MKLGLRTWGALAAVLLALCVSAGLVSSFAEEPLPFRDPYTGQTTDEEVSSVHYDLTYALALAAGFSVSDSITLQLWDQLVDTEQIGLGEAVSYTNCTGGAFYAPPHPAHQGVCDQFYAQVAWPRWHDMKDPDTCVASRFGPYSPFFHFPHDDDQELGALHDWAWGLTDTLVAYEAYAWGGSTVMQAECYYTRTAVITTGIEAGSLEAFATYLHSLADYYSHRECLAAMDDLGMPWATHTLTGVPECNYNPYSPQPDDVHGREFYTYTDALRTDVAIRHVYTELSARSEQGEGIHLPLNLEAPLSGTQTLSDMLAVFVHGWPFDQPEARRAQADRIAGAVLATRQPLLYHVYLPLIVRH